MTSTCPAPEGSFLPAPPPPSWQPLDLLSRCPDVEAGDGRGRGSILRGMEVWRILAFQEGALEDAALLPCVSSPSDARAHAVSVCLGLGFQPMPEPEQRTDPAGRTHSDLLYPVTATCPGSHTQHYIYNVSILYIYIYRKET